MKSDIFARRYGDNTILKLITNTNHKMLYGIYDATKYIFGFADMYIDDIICGAPIEINADLLADFLGGV